MSIKNTEHYTREQAISTIARKKLEELEKLIKNQLELLTNEKLEVLLEECIRNEFENYIVED